MRIRQGTKTGILARLSGLFPRRTVVASLLLYAAFDAVLILTELGLLIPADVWAAQGTDPLLDPAMDALFPYVATLWSPESCVILGLAAGAFLWRTGARLWSLAPLGFVAIVPLEAVLKLTFQRPAMPWLLKPWPSYAVVNFIAPAAVLNGSPIRNAFFCLLAALVLWRMGGKAARTAALVAMALDAVTVLIRCHGRYHWLSGELTGQLLGASLAVLLAAPLGRQLSKVRGCSSVLAARNGAAPDCGCDDGNS